MNTKEINIEIKKRLEVDSKVLDQLMDSLSVIIKNEILEGNSIALQGFGTFELRKKSERISVNPTTKQRMLVPPKQTLSFKPSSILKEKFNQEN
ncbi:MAG: HU family DNA-binding protein [Paludibacteraceae bacterium]|jgi:DNA-binding protein HU-beta|nr:HU family DNA-binding protein [Paludibacteraceae bacterium]MEE0911269.1 HU family DNA-binding protein [Paludibacteraceae bacterium]